ncbi:macrophage mannose receptor 1-like [Hippocampus zosterae]|uniref:macrophage mannose receptor 1-like n=1 Tax=Hippocampus zosterae TaxID=109293 RepID=UPI00223D5518|nr:macrophage mannose receptor 1-like [Hippocampus zosterae]
MNATRWLLVALRLLALGECATSDSGCESDEVSFQGFCYYFNKKNQKLDWQKAEDYCLKRKSHLISIHSQEEWDFLKDHVLRGWTWLGMKKFKGKKVMYSDGTAVDENPWFSFNLSGMSVSMCLTMDARGSLSYSNCKEQISFVCKKAKGVADNRLQQPVWSEECGLWTHNPSNDLCYWFNNKYWTTWPMARIICNHKNAELLYIANSNEQTFLQESLQVFGKETSMWIGAWSIPGNGWWWLTGSWVPYIRWTTGTYDSNPGERCLYLRASEALWGEDPCYNKRGFICKKKKAEKH